MFLAQIKDAPESPHFAVKSLNRGEIIKKLNGDTERFEQIRGRELEVSYKVCAYSYCLKMFHEFTENNFDYLIYEVCPGGDLQDLQGKNEGNRLDEVLVKEYLKQTSIAMQQLHDNRIVHRDIKPENILLNSEGECRLADFGASRILKPNNDFCPETTESVNETVAGTNLFMSPEMKGEKPNGTKTDVWSLGITVGFLIGLANQCPETYKGGIPQYILHCVNGRHDLSLAKVGIYISPILKSLMKGMLTINEKNRMDMNEIVHHKFITEDLEVYRQGYEKWKDTESARLELIMKKEEETLGKVSEAHKAKFMSLDDEDKEFYLSFDDKGKAVYIEFDFDDREKYEALTKPQQDYINDLPKFEDRLAYLSLKEENRNLYPKLHDHFKGVLGSLNVKDRDPYMELNDGQRKRHAEAPADNKSSYIDFGRQKMLLKIVKTREDFEREIPQAKPLVEVYLKVKATPRPIMKDAVVGKLVLATDDKFFGHLAAFLL